MAANSSSAVVAPRATYRFQFHRGFTLRQAQELIPYLHDLGISHVYASPLLKARPGSTHGYDVCDPAQLNPELGTEADLAALAAALRERKMGLVVDLVPNHMGIGGRENAWWWDVLAHGPASAYAGHFDIDWESPDARLRGKVLVPVLGDRYDRVLERGELRLERGNDGVVLRYFDHQFPVDPVSVPGQPAALAELIRQCRADANVLDGVVQQQHYRLTFWRQGDTELNYRRFFNITTLAGVRVEDEQVFRDTHTCVLRWHDQGWVAGLRIDHPDGLRDPEGYLRRLRLAAPAAWIVVEKILEPGEALPQEWPADGTTGYDFLNRAGGLLVDPAGETALTQFYAEFTGEPTDYAALVRDKKRQGLRDLLAAEVAWLTRLLVAVASRHWRGRDFPVEHFREAIIELAANFPVYRTYAQSGQPGVSAADAAHVEQAVTAAQSARPDLAPELFAFLDQLLRLRLGGEAEEEFVLRFQQLTGPAMAKGVEDTTFYCYNRLVALNEVGGNPGQFGCSVEQFHEACRQAQAQWPRSMLASSTHDTKRSEDVRARLSLLSEMPAPWIAAVRQWAGINARHRCGDFPDRNAEYVFYQTLVGAWPLSTERALAYVQKAAREARQHVTWTERNPEYDEALRRFVSRTLADPEFVAVLEAFVAPLVAPGYVNSLAQILLKLTAPGVPDVYQGTELWDFSLVDPDNRRPVNYDLRRQWMRELTQLDAPAVWRRRAEGLPKLWLIQKAMEVRREHPEWFGDQGTYEPVAVRGKQACHVVAFVRAGKVAAVAPRLVLGLNNDWADTALELPAGRWRNVLTGERMAGGACPCTELLAQFPVALLDNSDS